jgi:hypothetical protein
MRDLAVATDEKGAIDDTKRFAALSRPRQAQQRVPTSAQGGAFVRQAALSRASE